MTNTTDTIANGRPKLLFGRYRVLDHLGSGGMAHVYKVEDVTDHSIWAVKVMDHNPENENEARLIMGLSHPALVRCREYIVEGPNLFLVMECVHGTTMAKVLKSGSVINEECAVRWAAQLADILVYLHGLPTPVIYRDLKPSNIMVRPDNTLCLIDFGIASEYQGILTGEKKVKALTKGYAAPEQYSKDFGEDVRTDIYSLGVTFHYLLTGKNPLDPPYKFVPVRKLNPAVSLGSEYICKQCLRNNPDQRYASARDLAFDLAHVDDVTRDVKKRNGTRSMLAIFAGICCVIALVCVFMVARASFDSGHIRYLQLVDEAHACVLSGDYDEAERLLDTAIDIDSSALDAHLGKAELLLEQGDSDASREYLNGHVVGNYADLAENEQFNELVNRLKR